MFNYLIKLISKYILIYNYYFYKIKEIYLIILVKLLINL